MPKNLQRIIFASTAVLAIAVLLGAFLPPSVHAGGIVSSDNAYTQMNVYEEVLRKIQNDYVTVPSLPSVTDGALHGLVSSLDADSSYLTPAEFTTYKKELADTSTAAEDDGIGLTVSVRSGYTTIVSVLPGSPAAKAGLQEEDVIEAIDGQSTQSMAVAMIRALLKGKPGSTVALTMIQPEDGSLATKKIVRAAVPTPPLETKQYDQSAVLYLKPIVLTRDRVDELIRQLKGMKKDGNKEVLLDLRDVAVGDEDQGVRLANAFVQSGTIATLSGQKYPEQTFAADPAKFVTGAPLAVLVNHGTSGAAEIVAAAVLDSKRGDVIGEKTFGEGSVQKTIELPDGGALLLTVAQYNGPDGKAIENNAVQPNILVSLSIDQFLEQEYGPSAGVPAHPQVDDQLNKALDVLKAKLT
jgi:carboxyl-terminal processing protease